MLGHRRRENEGGKNDRQACSRSALHIWRENGGSAKNRRALSNCRFILHNLLLLLLLTMDASNGGVLGCTAVSVIENEGGENFVTAITLNGDVRLESIIWLHIHRLFMLLLFLLMGRYFSRVETMSVCMPMILCGARLPWLECSSGIKAGYLEFHGIQTRQDSLHALRMRLSKGCIYETECAYIWWTCR